MRNVLDSSDTFIFVLYTQLSIYSDVPLDLTYAQTQNRYKPYVTWKSYYIHEEMYPAILNKCLSPHAKESEFYIQHGLGYWQTHET